jgi:branched-chain amino acid transport system permease protein
MLIPITKGPQLFMIGVVSLFMAVCSLWISDPYYQLILSTVPIWATVALTWNLFSGYTGLISFGHATFFGLGAFTVALLFIKLGISPWYGLMLAFLVGGCASVVIGSITFRLRGHYFAIAMLAYPSLFIFLFDWMGWQELTFPIVHDHPMQFMQFKDGRVYTLMGVGLMTLTLLLTLFIERSRFGLAMMSIKQNEMAAQAAGINTFRVKMRGFVLSGALGALVGGFHAVVLQVVTPHGVLGTVVSAQALILTLFGGVGTLWGPVIGASFLVPLTEGLRAELGHILPGIQGVIYGMTIMIVIIVAPEGLYWKVRDLLGRKNKESAEVKRKYQQISHASLKTTHDSKKNILLRVEGVSKAFGGLQALKNVNFEVYENEILGIIGPNGAGKTTLFNVLNGFQIPDAGVTAFMDINTTGQGPHQLCAIGMGRTFQVSRPFLRMNVFDNVLVGTLGVCKDSAHAKQLAHQALNMVGMGEMSDQSIQSLTNLELRLLELARALASQPKLLLLDETMAGLGATEVEAILQVIQYLPSQGITIVIIEHTMQAMMRLVDRMVVLDHGQVIAKGLPQTVMDEPEVINAYLGKKWMSLHASH